MTVPDGGGWKDEANSKLSRAVHPGVIYSYSRGSNLSSLASRQGSLLDHAMSLLGGSLQELPPLSGNLALAHRLGQRLTLHATMAMNSWRRELAGSASWIKSARNRSETKARTWTRFGRRHEMGQQRRNDHRPALM